MSTQQDSSFTPFPRLPAELRNEIWEISVQDYPARIVDIREYCRPISPTCLPAEAPNSITESNFSDVQNQKETDHAREIADFKSRVPAPTLLYICRDSRGIAQKSYVKAFGTTDIPAETWIDFEKDIVYLSMAFCEALRGVPNPD